MMRRSRISVRPNVRPGGRGPASEDAAEGGPSRRSAENGKEEEEATAAGSTFAPSAPPESSPGSLEKTAQNGETSSAHASVATSLPRRKRVSAMPNLAKPRVASEATRPSANVSNSTGSAAAKPQSRPQGSAPLSGNRAQAGSGAARAPRSPGRSARSDGARRSGTQEEPGSALSLVPGVAAESGAPSEGETNDGAAPLHSSQSADLTAVTQQNVKDINTLSQVPSVVLTKVSQGSTLPEKALPSTSAEPRKGLRISSDRQKIAKARRLKALMKQEMKKEKEKERKKSRPPIFEFQNPLDTSKMTMRDLIYYLPLSNPMKSQLLDNCTEKETPTQPRDELPERIETGLEEEDDRAEDEDEQPVMVPRVKVAEDGSLIIDEDSLTVEVQRGKGPAIVENTDPVFERGSTTTYSSFRKLKHTKQWSDKETDMFFLAINMVGTDFSMIGQLFPHRARTEIKNKFKKEERVNGWRIDKAFREKRPYDQEFFSILLEKVLAADQMKKKKNNQSFVKKPRSRRKDKIEKQAGESPDIAEDEVDGNMAEGDLETAEKENEDSSNVLEPGDNTSATRNRSKRKVEKEAKEIASKEHKPERKKKKRMKKSVDDDVVAIFGDSEDDVTDSQAAAEQAVSSTEGVTEENKKETVPKSAQSRGRHRKSLPNVGKKAAKRTLKSPEKSKDDDLTDNVICNDDHIMIEAEASDLEGMKAKKIRRILSSEEESTAEDEQQHDTSTVQEEMLNKPTRSGRIPKLSKKLKQAEDDDTAVSPPTSPPAQKETSPIKHRKIQTGKPNPSLHATNRKGRMSNSQLVSLQPSSPEISKGDCDSEQEEACLPINPEEQNLFSLAEPAGLSSPVPLPKEVQETMEEDMIGTFSPEQLDGLAENTECACEAARTLLSISDSELPQIEEAQNTENLSVAVESLCQALLEEPKSSLSSSQMVQSLCSTEAPECAVSAIPDMVASEPIEEMSPTEEFQTSTELHQQPSETASSAGFILNSNESFDKTLSMDPLVQIVPQQPSPPTESPDLPTTGNIHPEAHNVASQKPAEQKNIELYDIEEATTEQCEKVSDKQNQSSDKPARGEVLLDIAKGSDSSVESDCKGSRQFPKPNLGQAQHTCASQSNDALSTSVPVGTVLQICMNEEENNADNVQSVTPKHNEKQDEQSLKLNRTSREAGSLEGVADTATSVQSVLPKRCWLPRARPNLRQTVEAICVTAAAAAAAAAAVPVGTVSEKPAEEAQPDSENVIEMSSERSKAEESKKQTHDAQRVEDSLDSTVGPDSVDRTPASKPVPQGRRNRFPKPRPNFSRASRIPQAAVAQSTDSCELKNTSEDGDLETVPLIDKNRIPGVELVIEEKVRNVVSISVEDPKSSPESPSEGEKTEALTDEAMQVMQTEQAVEESMAVAAMELGSCCANVASALPVEDPYSNTSQVAEGMPVTTDYRVSEPTFILTLFSVNDEPFPSPLVSTDAQPELLVTESEPQSSKALLESTVEAWTEDSEVSNLFINDPFVPLCEDQERDTKQDQISEWCTSSDQKHSTVDPEDLSGTEEHTHGKTQPPLSPKGKKKTPPRSKRAKPIIKGKLSKPEKEDEAKLKVEMDIWAIAPPSPPTVQRTAVTPVVQVLSKEETVAVSSFSEPAEDMRGQLDPLPMDRKAEDGAGCESGGEKPSLGVLSPDHSLTAPLTRSGRKPRGFLSFMSSSSASETSSPLTSRSLSRKPNVNASHTVRNRTSLNPDQACSLSSATKDEPPLANFAEVPSSSDPGQSEFLCVRTTDTDEEPSNVSEFFLGDIFTEVEDPL